MHKKMVLIYIYTFHTLLPPDPKLSHKLIVYALTPSARSDKYQVQASSPPPPPKL